MKSLLRAGALASLLLLAAPASFVSAQPDNPADLDSYEFVNKITPIKSLRYCITHANFPSQLNLERC